MPKVKPPQPKTLPDLSSLRLEPQASRYWISDTAEFLAESDFDFGHSDIRFSKPVMVESNPGMASSNFRPGSGAQTGKANLLPPLLSSRTRQSGNRGRHPGRRKVCPIPGFPMRWVRCDFRRWELA